MPRDALLIDFGGEKFRFFFDRPGVLHITNRHGTTPEEAIAAFFSAGTPGWDEEHKRFESLSTTHGLYWARHDHDDSVIVISCWRRTEG